MIAAAPLPAPGRPPLPLAGLGPAELLQVVLDAGTRAVAAGAVSVGFWRGQVASLIGRKVTPALLRGLVLSLALRASEGPYRDELFALDRDLGILDGGAHA